jgi:hypothetical protein
MSGYLQIMVLTTFKMKKEELTQRKAGEHTENHRKRKTRFCRAPLLKERGWGEV